MFCKKNLAKTSLTSLSRITENNQFKIVGIILFAMLLSWRFCFFANKYAGFEQDSGWFLSQIRNFAQTGQYAHNTNIFPHHWTGSHTGVHGQKNIQDDDGYIHFSPNITLGPASLIPHAIILKLLGHKLWTFRIWQQLTFFLMTIVLLFLCWKAGNYFATFVLMLYLWAFPNLTIIYSFETLGESTALLYLLIAFYFLCKYKNENSVKNIVIASTLFSFSVLTKVIFLMYLPIFPGVIIITNLKSKKKIIKTAAIFFLTFLLPILLFELYRLYYIMHNFGYLAWKDNLAELVRHFTGVEKINVRWDPHLFSKKLSLFSKAGFKWKSLSWIIIFSTITIESIYIIKNKKNNYLWFLLLSAATLLFTWFLFKSSAGYYRYAWPGIMMIIPIYIISAIPRNKRQLWIKIPCILLLLFNINLKSSVATFFIDKSHVYSWENVPSSEASMRFPTNFIYPLYPEAQVVKYIENNVSANDRVYWFIDQSSAISALTDRVFFPYQRFSLDLQKKQFEKAFVLFGPQLVSNRPFCIFSTQQLQEAVNQVCQKIVLQNNFWVLCLAKT